MATDSVLEPFRELLKIPSDKKVCWDLQLQHKFDITSDTICQLVGDGLVYYDQTRPTDALTDCSRDGIGFIILQQYCPCVWTKTHRSVVGMCGDSPCVGAGTSHPPRPITQQWRRKHW